MIIFKTEKNVLLKHYAERIKSYSSNLKQIIEEGKFDALNEHLNHIKDCVQRMGQITTAWSATEADTVPEDK